MKETDEKIAKMSREAALTPADYDRWDGRIGIRVINPETDCEAEAAHEETDK